MRPEVIWLRLPLDEAKAQAWADRWDALAATTPQRMPMLSYAWVDAYARTFGGGPTELRCVLACRGDRLLGVLPLVVHERGIGGLGTACASTPYDDHTAFGDALLCPDEAYDTLAALLDAARKELGGRLSEIALRGVAATSATAQCGRSPLPGLHTLVDKRGRGSYLPVATGLWTEHRSRLSKNFRQNLRKADNRMREAGLLPTYEWLAGAEADPERLGIFLALESSGWKGRAGSSIAQDDRRLDFYRALVNNMHQRGWLEWHLMQVGDRTIAAHLAIRMDRSLVLLKIAYDEAHARYSPGTLLFEKLAERAFADADTDEINCLTDMEWHKPWQMLQREYLDYRYYPKTPVGLAAGLGPRIAYRAFKRIAAKRSGS